jgi:hypothetical protein
MLLIFLKNYNYYHPYPLFELTHSRALSIHQNHPMDSLTSHCGLIMGADALSNRITALQAKLNIEQK